ncbi:hypothetical protein V5O48_018787 [Marasmius crinis-equi]|uniref:Uncharacterized protein n=1 Tax=Marasmius crinis-equi TaxID=585013 RepID=A0ABR3EK68_9AGAR
MFGLIRRISGSVIPRPDRPWEEDATSNAPKIGRKRRRSSTEQDAAVAESSSKRVRGDTPAAQDEASTSMAPAADTEGMKEVTKGVKEVELEDKDKNAQEEKVDAESEKVQPESVPLPDEVVGELDSASIASTPPPEGDAAEEEKDKEAAAAVEAAAGTEQVPAGVKEDQSSDDETKVDDITQVEKPNESTNVETAEIPADATPAQETEATKN